jgi:hypothetical protein
LQTRLGNMSRREQQQELHHQCINTQATSVTNLHFCVCSQDQLPIFILHQSPPSTIFDSYCHRHHQFWPLNIHHHQRSNLQIRNFGSDTISLRLIHQLKCRNKTNSIRVEQERQKRQKGKKKRKPPNLACQTLGEV